MWCMLIYLCPILDTVVSSTASSNNQGVQRLRKFNLTFLFRYYKSECIQCLKTFNCTCIVGSGTNPTPDVLGIHIV